jgi:putative type I restriction enzyme (specificity subunit)
MNNAKNTTLFPYLERLLEGEAVEWKTLGEITELYTGLSGKNKEHFKKGNAPYVTYKNIFENLAVDSSILEMVRIEADERQHSIKYGDILITGSSENIEEVGMASVVTFHPETGIYLNSFSFGIRFHPTVQLSPEFTKYLFRSDLLRKQIMKTASGVTRFNVSKKKFSAITIPIPPLRVQARIVEILDKFTQLEAELEAELEARKKQYAYYRDQLLNFSQCPPLNVNIEWKTLGEVCSILRGRRLTKKQLSEEGKYPVFHGGLEPIGYYDESNRKGDTTMVINVGASAGTIGYSQNDFWSSDGCFCISDTPLALSRFIFYVLQSKELQIKGKVRKAGIPTLDSNILEQLPIPLPPLSEQRRIVDILDRFDTLTNSISEGLPKEIALRRKQYEYYRDALLSFPRPEATV